MADQERRDELMSLRAKRMRHLPRGVETTMQHRSAPVDAELAKVRAKVLAALDQPRRNRRPVVATTTTPTTTPTTRARIESPELLRARRHLERIR